MNKQHVQLPNDMTSEEKSLTPKDLLVYVSIKRYMNNQTKEAFPSLTKLTECSSLSKPTIVLSIDNLVKAGFISVRRQGRKNVYKFNSYKNFEPFSYEFLDKPDLTANEKAYILASQQYMFKDEEHYGKITYTELELSSKINMPRSSINRYNNSLREKGYLSILGAKDSETGLIINEKLFHLNELGQAIVFALQNHEDRISNNEKTLELALKEINNLRSEIDKLKGVSQADVLL